MQRHERICTLHPHCLKCCWYCWQQLVSGTYCTIGIMKPAYHCIAHLPVFHSIMYIEIYSVDKLYKLAALHSYAVCRCVDFLFACLLLDASNLVVVCAWGLCASRWEGELCGARNSTLHNPDTNTMLF